MSSVIDGFAHVLPLPFAEKLVKVYDTAELRELVILTHFSDMEHRVRILDKYRIDKQVLTLARPNIWINMPVELMSDLTRKANDSVALAARQFPDRFIAVGTLPYPGEEFMPEFERCISELGMAGIQVFSNISGKYLDAPEFRAFFARANETKTPIWIHPQCREEWSHEFILDKILGWPYDTTVALCRLVFSGLMEEFPNLKIITHHMGGMTPHFSERIKSFYDVREMFPRCNSSTLPKDPLEYFRRFYGDTVLNGSIHAFECGHKFFGTEHTVFATDYPFGPQKGETWMAGALRQLSEVNMSREEKELIFSGNLERIMQRT